jgi:hypothetical protein
VATEIFTLFTNLEKDHFPIYSIIPIEFFNGTEQTSVNVDNTSAFNCRKIVGQNEYFSKHAYGLAIDINPKENPFIAEPHQKQINRTQLKTIGIITHQSIVYKLFLKFHWRWGGDWKKPVDYHHFEKEFN